MKNLLSLLLLLSTFTCFSQYTDINPDKQLQGTTSVTDYEYIDINNDGTNDLTFSDRAIADDPPLHPYKITGTTQTKFAFVNSTTIFFNYGDTIDSSQGYKSTITDFIPQYPSYNLYAPNVFLGIQVTQGTDIYYGWVRFDYIDNYYVILKDYYLNSIPNTPIKAGENVPLVATKLQLADNNVFLDGRSLKLYMEPHPFPSNIIEYRCMLINETEVPTFTVDSAILINPTNYVINDPTSFQYNIQFTQTTTDVNGDIVDNSKYYQAVVLSMVDNTIDTTWYISTFSNPVKISNPTTKPNSIYLIDNDSNNNSADATLYFHDLANGLGVTEYRLIFSNSSTNGLLNLTQLLAVNSSNYFTISTASILDSIILPGNLTDIDGNFMTDSIPYDVYVVSVCDSVLTDSSSFGMMAGKYYLNNPDYLYTGHYNYPSFHYHEIDSTINYEVKLDVNNDGILDFFFLSHDFGSPMYRNNKLAIEPLQNNKIANLTEIVADTGRQFNSQLTWTTNELILLEYNYYIYTGTSYNYGDWDLKRRYVPFIVYTTTDTLIGWFEVSKVEGFYRYLLEIKGYGYYSTNAIGIDQPNDELITDFNIYPNPFTSSLNIESKSIFKGTVEITSIDGRLINTFELSNHNTKINLIPLKAGTYILKIHHSGYTYTKKIIKR
ncbi:MAG: T9SS type A sorting domain-containing protein [Bacteroidetes bacterium]|nr:T9SS type A sorting domain-containing protein [Bacteroidota bacterium]